MDIKWYHLLGVLVLITAVSVVVSDGTGVDRFGTGSSGSVAVVQLSGPIAYGNGVGSSGISPDSIRTLTDRAVDEGADAIIYEINSGGGAVVASRQAAQVVERAEVPTVCRITEVGASGAYWIASACDRIVADPLSLTGSIGVTATYLEVSELLEEFGVEYVNLTSAEFKDMGSQYKNLTPAERERFDRILDGTHAAFVDAIASNRNMSEAEVAPSADGQVMLGTDAHERGLVDRLGGHGAAMDVARNLTGYETLSTRTYSPPRQFDFLSLLASRVGEGIASGLQGDQAPGLDARYRP